jgi:hypothetical protein
MSSQMPSVLLNNMTTLDFQNINTQHITRSHIAFNNTLIEVYNLCNLHDLQL